MQAEQPSGGRWEYQYDGFGRVSRVTGPLSFSMEFERTTALNGSSNSLSISIGGARVETIDYDGFGRRIHVERQLGSNVVTGEDFRRDSLGNLIDEIGPYLVGDPNPRTTRIVSDVLGRTVRSTAPDSSTTLTKYTGRDSYTLDASGHLSIRSANSLGRVDHYSRLAGQYLTPDAPRHYEVKAQTQASFDVEGHLTALSDETGDVLTANYDDWGPRWFRFESRARNSRDVP